MKKKPINTILFLLIFIFASEYLYTQKMIVKNIGGFLLPEGMAMLNMEKGNVVCKFIPSPENRPKNYQNLDLKSGDVILYINGQKIKSIKDMKNNYELFKPGEEIRMGIKREESTFIISFIKADQKDSPQNENININTSNGHTFMETVTRNSKNEIISRVRKEINADSLEKSGNGNAIIIKKTKGKK